MTHPRKVAFFGSPAFALPVLEAIRAEFEVVLIVAQPDKPAGRGNKLTPPAVASYARANNLTLTQPVKLRKNLEFEGLLRSSGAEVAITCAYGKILPLGLLEVPRFGFLNTHTSLLPKLRGAAPIQWALISGETLTGTTIMQTDPGMDTGPIILQECLEIEPHWTALELSHALSRQASSLIVQALRDVDTLERVSQDNSKATHAPMLEKEDGEIRWTDSSADIYNRYRGVFAWPGTYTFQGGKRVKVLKLRPLEGSGKAGEILGLSSEGVIVACGEGAIELLEVQPGNKGKMSALEWFKGFQVNVGNRFGKENPNIE